MLLGSSDGSGLERAPELAFTRVPLYGLASGVVFAFGGQVSASVRFSAGAPEDAGAKGMN